MTAKIARLRPVPTIAFEPEEGKRLERNPITLHHSLRLRNSCGIRLG